MFVYLRHARRLCKRLEPLRVAANRSRLSETVSVSNPAPDLSQGKLGHAVVVSAVETTRQAAHPAAAIAGGEPAPLRPIDRSIARASNSLIEKRHTTILRCQHRIGADRALD